MKRLWLLVALLAPAVALAQLQDLDFTAPDADTLPEMAQKINANNAAVTAADDALDGRLDTAELDIVNLEAADSALDGRVDTLEMGSGGVSQTTGTFEVTWPTACDTTPSQTWNYVLTGSVVHLTYEDAVSCTSDSTDFLSTAGDLPMALRPARDVTLWVGAMNNGSAVPGCLRISTAGTFSIANRATDALNLCPNSSGSWTASGVKRFRATSDSGYPGYLSYTLN